MTHDLTEYTDYPNRLRATIETITEDDHVLINDRDAPVEATDVTETRDGRKLIEFESTVSDAEYLLSYERTHDRVALQHKTSGDKMLPLDWLETVGDADADDVTVDTDNSALAVTPPLIDAIDTGLDELLTDADAVPDDVANLYRSLVGLREDLRLTGRMYRLTTDEIATLNNLFRVTDIDTDVLGDVITDDPTNAFALSI